MFLHNKFKLKTFKNSYVHLKEIFFQVLLNQIKNLIVFLCPLILFSQSTDRVITTGVPFLLITPDARALGWVS